MELRRTQRTELRRKPERGSYDGGVVNAILDEGLICHVAVVIDGSPVVLPTAYGRIDDALYLHGARSNRMLRALAAGASTCLTVTLLDGLVFARSAFRHSMNYRSVVLYGAACEVTDEQEKRRALGALIDHMAPGRSADARGPDEGELAATLVVKLPISEGSAKVRAGGPNDLAVDLDAPIWAGVLPLRLAADPPPESPRYIGGWKRPIPQG